MGNSNWLNGCGFFGRARVKAGSFVNCLTISAAGLALVFGALPLRVAAQAPPPSTAAESSIQLLQPPAQGQATPPITVTLQDALERARKLDPVYLSAVTDAKNAQEDRLQARNALLPSVTASTQFLGTQGDGGKISDGRFVTNDGIHVYRAWGVFHQDLSPGTFMATGLRGPRRPRLWPKPRPKLPGAD